MMKNDKKNDENEKKSLFQCQGNSNRFAAVAY